MTSASDSCHSETDAWVGLVGGMGDPHLLKLVRHLVLTNRGLGVEGEDIILQAYTEYLMGQDKLGLIP